MTISPFIAYYLFKIIGPMICDSLDSACMLLILFYPLLLLVMLCVFVVLFVVFFWLSKNIRHGTLIDKLR